MAKFMAALTALLTCLILLAPPAKAATFVDLSGEADQSVRVADSNLAKVSYGKNFDETDWVQFAVQAGEGGLYKGAVRYQFWGASRVTLRVYSPAGTFAVPGSELQFGINSLSPVFDPKGVLTAYFHPGERKIYAYSRSWQMLDTQQGSPGFVPATEGFNGNGLINYGVNVYVASRENGVRTSLALSRSSIEVKALEDASGMLCAEDFTAEIPSGTRFLWVELNDLGGTALTRKGYRTSLAWVQITGDSLAMGPYEEKPPAASGEVESSVEEDVKTASSQSVKSSKKTSLPSAAPPAGTTAGTSKPPAASSKFEGVITSSQSGAGSKKKTQESVMEAESSQMVLSIPEQEAPPLAEMPLIYEIQREKEKPDIGYFGIIIYILLIAAIILYLLMRPQKQ